MPAVRRACCSPRALPPAQGLSPALSQSPASQPCRAVSRPTTRPRSAPSAIRIPISLLRCVRKFETPRRVQSRPASPQASRRPQTPSPSSGRPPGCRVSPAEIRELQVHVRMLQADGASFRHVRPIMLAAIIIGVRAHVQSPEPDQWHKRYRLWLPRRPLYFVSGIVPTTSYVRAG